MGNQLRIKKADNHLKETLKELEEAIYELRIKTIDALESINKLVKKLDKGEQNADPKDFKEN